MKTIGVVGIGIMGGGIAANYLKGGYDVVIWNRSLHKTKSLQANGAKLADTPKQLTELSDVIFEVTADDNSSRTVWEGEQGILAGASSDKVLVASATLSTDWTDEIAEVCAQNELNFLDMPLTGGSVAAKNGTLTLLVGGPESLLDQLRPDLEAISSKVIHFGKVGSGMRYKLVLNALQATHLAAFGEAMNLAKKQGLDFGKVGPALCERPGGIVTEIAWKAYQQEHPDLTFSVDWITKDLSYAKQMDSNNEALILKDVLGKFKTFQQDGHGGDDWTTVNSHS